jgi:hypothetical protein
MPNSLAMASKSVFRSRAGKIGGTLRRAEDCRNPQNSDIFLYKFYRIYLCVCV